MFLLKLFTCNIRVKSSAKIDPFVKTTIDNVSRQRIESSLTQIESIMPGKSKKKKKRGEQFSVQSGNDFRAAKQRQNGLPAEIVHSPEIAFISKETKEAKRLKRTKKAKKSRLREEKRLKRSKQIEKMETNEQSKLKEQRNHKGRNARSLKQQGGDDDTNDHSEDISILNSEAMEDIAIEPSISLQQISKPKKETRIVPVKIGSTWTFKTLSESDPKFKDPPQENNSLSELSSILPMKRGHISLTGTESGCNENRRKRVKITTEKERILIPTPGARRKRTAGEFKSQQGNILISTGEELADNQNGRQSPTLSSTTNSSSTSWSDRPLIETLRESRESNRVHSDGTVDPGRRATRKEKCEQVADIWQENPGKIRGRLGTSEDMEVEESTQLYF